MINLNFKNQSGILLLFLSSLCSYNCSNDASLATVDETTSDKLSNEEKFFLSRLNTNNHITPIQAEQIIRDETTGITTRGMSDLQIVGIIENKQEEGQEKYQLDTLAYLFESKGQSKRYIVSADDRTHEMLLAEYNYDGGENENIDILYNIDCLIRSGISSYVRNEVVDFETRKDSILASIYRKTGQSVNGDTRTTRGPIPKDDSLDEIVYVDEYIENWHRVGYKAPMLTVSWNQDSPYNDNVKDTLLCGDVYVGCVTVAVAQLMSYWAYPDSYDWDDLTANPEISQGTSAASEVATLMKNVFIGCGVTPGCDGSSSNIYKARNFLVNIGYTCSNIQYYTASAIEDALRFSHPVLITGNVSNEEGHAWNIDGYEKEKAVICRRAYRYDEATGTRILFSTSTFEKYKTKFHYNWGWGGLFNGWFADGCFQPCSGESNYNKSVKFLVATH